jgi:hypothetical protein
VVWEISTVQNKTNKLPSFIEREEKRREKRFITISRHEAS